MPGTRDARGGRANGRGGVVDEKPAASTGKMVGIIFAFILVGALLGAGAGYGYWKLSTPKPAAASQNPPTLTSPAPASATSPVASPAATGTTAP